MQPSSSSSRISVKASTEAGFVSGHSRRQHALDRQRRDRQAEMAAQRQALVEAVIAADAAAAGKAEAGAGRRPIVCEIPEWMVDVPDDLFDRWSVGARPEGQRCIGLGAITTPIGDALS